MKSPHAAASAAIKRVGGAKLAKALGLTRQAVYQWQLVPPQHVIEVEKLTGVSRHELRPDIYPEEAAQ